MCQFRFTPYFEYEVLRKRPYLRKAMCMGVVESPAGHEEQSDGRHRYWAQVPELNGRYLRVVTLADGTTIHNAFLDRDFTP